MDVYPDKPGLVLRVQGDGPAFSLEPDQRTVGTSAFREVEFARADGLPLFFAGMWRPWTGRGTKTDPVNGH